MVSDNLNVYERSAQGNDIGGGDGFDNDSCFGYGRLLASFCTKLANKFVYIGGGDDGHVDLQGG